MGKKRVRRRPETGEERGPLVYSAGAPPMDRILMGSVLVLLLFGLVMLFSASYAAGYYQHEDSFYFIRSQFKFAVGGVIAMFAASWVNHRWMRVFCWAIYVGTLALLVGVFFCTPPEGLEEFHRWFSIGSFSFQPSEIAKFSIAVSCAWLGVKYQSRIRSPIFTPPKKPLRKLWQRMLYPVWCIVRNLWYNVLMFLVVLAPMAVLIYKEPHLSATVIMICITAIVLFAAGANWLWCGMALVGGTVGIGSLSLFLDKIIPLLPEHARSRLLLWSDPFRDALGDGMQTVQGLYAIGSGGLTGLGIGASRQKHLWVPEPYNDFIFSIICEELGFIGALVILALFGLLIIRGFLVAARCGDRFGSLLAAGITGQIAVQVFFNIGVVTGLLPNTGISLPFFSYGGTSLMMLLGEMGVLLSISRMRASPRPEKKPQPEQKPETAGPSTSQTRRETI